MTSTISSPTSTEYKYIAYEGGWDESEEAMLEGMRYHQRELG